MLIDLRKLTLYISMVYLWTRQKVVGSVQHCRDREPVINMCTITEVITTPTAYIETATVPEHQRSNCTCTITPLKPDVLVLLTYRRAPTSGFNMRFQLNDAVLDKSTLIGNTILLGETHLQLTTVKPQQKKNGVCLIVDTADASKFNISCEETISNADKGTTTEITHATSAATDNTRPKTKASDENTEAAKSVAGPIAGGALSGVVVLAFLIFLFIVCRRKPKPKKQDDTDEETNTHVKKQSEPTSDDDDYYMTENPMYNMPDDMLAAQTPGNEHPLIQAKDEGDRPVSDHYAQLPDSAVEEKLPLSKEYVHNTH